MPGDPVSSARADSVLGDDVNSDPGTSSYHGDAPRGAYSFAEYRSDNLLLLLGVSCIAACCLCWFLEHLAYLLRPLVFALGLSLILRPFVDFASDARYQRGKLRKWNARLPWHPRTMAAPLVYKVAVIGARKTGKSCITHRLVSRTKGSRRRLARVQTV